jgi:hypothetical protein
VTSARRRHSDPPAAAAADADLVAVGLRPGDRVRYRRKEGGRWHEATVERRERDGSIGVRDERGAARALPLERLEVRTTGPRGATTWEPVTERAGRTEQLDLL